MRWFLWYRVAQLYSKSSIIYYLAKNLLFSASHYLSFIVNTVSVRILVLQLIFVVFNCYLYRNKPLRFSLFIVALSLVSGWILETLDVLRLGKNCSTGSATLLLGNLSLNFTLSSNQIYHHKAVAYDYYSMNDIGQSKVGDQWRIWALPHEQVQLTNNILVYNFEVSPSFLSNLPLLTLFML